MYTDASSDHSCRVSCIGVVIDKVGDVHAFSEKVKFNENIAVIEAEAIIKALDKCSSIGLYQERITVCIDCETLYRCLLQMTGKEPEDLRGKIRLIKRKCKRFTKVSIVLVGRFIVEVAHKLAVKELRGIRESL